MPTFEEVWLEEWNSPHMTEELTWEQFEAQELADFRAWVSKRSRQRRFWLMSMEDFAKGNR